MINRATQLCHEHNITNSDIAGVFKQANSLIVANKQRYICYAIAAAPHTDRLISKNKHDMIKLVAKCIIEHALQQRGTVISWLRFHHPTVADTLSYPADRQAYRAMWLDRLITQFEQ